MKELEQADGFGQSANVRSPHDPFNLVNLTYRLILGREVDPDTLARRVAGLNAGIPFVDMFVEIANSEEVIRRGIGDDSKMKIRPKIIATAYQQLLSRKPRNYEIDYWMAKINNGLSLERFFENVLNSEEASILPVNSAVDPSDLIQIVYRLILGREIEPPMLTKRVEQLKAGVPFADMFIEIATSDEALTRARNVVPVLEKRECATVEAPIVDAAKVRLWSTIVASAYEGVLRRTPRDDEIEEWVGHLKVGLPIETFFQAVIESEEAKTRDRGPRLGPTQSDGEFLVRSSQLVFGRGLTPREVVICQSVINEVPERRVDFTINMINDHLRKKLLSDGQEELRYDAGSCQIMGTSRTLTLGDWEERRKELSSNAHDDTGELKRCATISEGLFKHTGSYKVSMIASLYKGGRFIRRFLENVTSQSLFDSAELIIVDANSPEHEHEVIKEYQDKFTNIVYRRINYRIGIYEAWNLAIDIARGCYLTNTNLDDVRRRDSIALQAALLDKNEEVDVVYQDFYYSFEPNLAFDKIAAYGFKSDLPILSPHNLLVFNSPHNAPMWRAALHDELGTFDTRYRSAGDHEFWARCIANGKTFRKMNSPHVAYYHNPEGLSTRPNTRGIEEGRDVISRYSERLISPALLQSRRDFARSVGAGTTEEMLPGDVPYFDVTQGALYRLGASRLATSSPIIP